MSDTLYREQILEHWRNPQNFGKLDRATHEAFLNNPLCGDEIGMQLRVNSGTVEDVRFYGTGCAVSIAAASLLTEVVRGEKLTGVQKIKKEAVFDLLGVTPSSSRVKCALLGWEVLQNLLQERRRIEKE